MGGAAPASVQGQAGPAAPGGPVVPVAQDHWVYDLLDRMAAAGVAAGAWLPGHRPSTADGILRALSAAEEEAEDGGDARWAGLAASARGWLAAEYGPAESSWGLVPAVEIRAGGGPGSRGFNVGIVPEAFWSPARGVSVFITPRLEFGESPRATIARGGAAWAIGNVLLTASRDNLRYGRGARGGIILGDESVLDGLGVALMEPVRASGLLRWLGAVDGSVHIGRIGADEYGETAALLAGELRLRPHPRFQVGVHRSALVVGTSADGERIGLRDIVYLGIGKHSDFEDQRVALAASVRVTVAEVDVLSYAELGLEDSAGIGEDPGVILGLHVPVLPGIAAPGLRYEYAAFGMDARVWVLDEDEEHWRRWFWRNWYRHGFVRSEYRDAGGRLLGHPLGGYGHQHLLELQAPLALPATVLEAGVFTREREATPTWTNLLFETFPGRSRGGYLEALHRRGALELGLGLSGEVGQAGWHRSEAYLQVRWLGLSGLAR